MELKTSGTWVRTAGGAWVNLALCDIIETESAGQGKTVRVVAWSAYQTQGDPHTLAECPGDKEAQALIEGLIAGLAPAAQR